MMNSSTKYQLMRVDEYGKEYPVTTTPGNPLPLFDLKKEAVEWAEQHPDYFPSSRFTTKAVSCLSEKAEEAILPQEGQG